MKAACLGLCLGLLGGVAMAQDAPSTAPPAPSATAPHVAAPPAGGPGAGAPPNPGAQTQQGPGDAYEGEVIETPSGTYLVGPRPDRTAPDVDAQDMPGAPEGGPGMPPGHPGGPDQAGGPDRMIPHHPHMRPLEGKAARFRIRAPGMELAVKCADDEGMKACVDGLVPLIDRIEAAHHP